MTKVNLTFAGRRLGKAGKISFLFMNGKDEHYYGRISRVWIGGIYPAEKMGKHLLLSRRPLRVGECEDEAAIEKWKMQDALVDAELAEKRATNKASKNKMIERFSSELAPHLKGLGYLEMHSIIKLIGNLASKKAMKMK